MSIFSNKIKCGCCGGWYGSKVWHSTDKYRKVIYRCNRKYGKDTPPCKILTNFITKLEDLTGEQTEFREELWGGLVDHIHIDEKRSTVVFWGGIEITI